MTSLQEKLCTAAAERLVGALESDYLTSADGVALTDEALLRLSQLTLNQQRYLIHHASHFLNIRIEPKILLRKLNDIESLSKTREMEDECLLLGAPLVLMRRLFGMHASEFSRRRQMLNIGGHATGRPKECDEDTEHLLWHQWQIHQDLEERQRFMTVAETTGVDLHVVWQALKHHIDR